MKDNISINQWVSFASMYVTTLSIFAYVYKNVTQSVDPQASGIWRIISEVST